MLTIKNTFFTKKEISHLPATFAIIIHIPASPSHTSPHPHVPSPHTRVPMSPSPCPRPTFIHSLLVWSLNIMKGHWSTLRSSLLTFSIRWEKRCITCKLKDWPWPLAWHPLSNLHWILVKIARTLFKLDALIFAGQKRHLEIMTCKDKAFTWCTIWHVNLYTRIFIGV